MDIDFSTNKSELLNTWNSFLDENEIDSWILYGIRGANYCVVYENQGNGGLSELCEEFDDGKFFFAGLIVNDPKSGLNKVLFLFWKGECVSALMRGRSTIFLNGAKDFFRGFHVSITASAAEDLSTNNIMDKAFSGSAIGYSKGTTSSNKHISTTAKSSANRAENYPRQQSIESQIKKSNSIKTQNIPSSYTTNKNNNEKDVDVLKRTNFFTDTYEAKQSNNEVSSKIDFETGKGSYYDSQKKSGPKNLNPFYEKESYKNFNVQRSYSPIPKEEENLRQPMQTVHTEKFHPKTFKTDQSYQNLDKNIQTEKSTFSHNFGNKKADIDIEQAEKKESEAKKSNPSNFSALSVRDRTKLFASSGLADASVQKNDSKQEIGQIRSNFNEPSKKITAPSQSNVRAQKKVEQQSSSQQNMNKHWGKVEKKDEEPNTFLKSVDRKEIASSHTPIKPTSQRFVQTQHSIDERSHSSIVYSKKDEPSTVKPPVNIIYQNKEPLKGGHGVTKSNFVSSSNNKIDAQSNYASSKNQIDSQSKYASSNNKVDFQSKYASSSNDKIVSQTKPVTKKIEVKSSDALKNDRSIMSKQIEKDLKYEEEKKASAQKLPSQTNLQLKNQNFIFKVRVNYSYVATDPDELSIKEDEILEIISCDEDWWEARNSKNELGFIPSNFVEKIESSIVSQKQSQEKIREETSIAYQKNKKSEHKVEAKIEPKKASVLFQVEALFDFEGSADDDLIFGVGQTLDIINDDGDWWKARNSKGEEGMIPSNYVAKKINISTSKSLINQKLPESMKVQYDFIKVSNDELSINEGETVTLIDAGQDGWSFVQNESGQEGYVPTDFLLKINN